MKRPRCTVGLGALALVALLVLPGCYSRVTGESGFTAGSSDTVYEPNDTSTPLDGILYGDDAKTQDR
ncbi:MAG: hypothetical protein AAFX05_14490 [Planctomycetota bacterium]